MRREVGPHLSELATPELIRLALAAKSHAAEGKELLEAVAGEAMKRLADLPQVGKISACYCCEAHLLLMTQGLVALGGQHPKLRQICGYWAEAGMASRL